MTADSGAKPCRPVAGVSLAAIASGIRYTDRLDLVLMAIDEGASVAGVFTRNAFCAAPVELCRAHLGEAKPRYFVINTGNANAGTGKTGLQAARRCCQAVAELAGVEEPQVLPFSTGVIGEPLPVDKILQGLPAAYEALSPGAWESAAEGILTTDTRPKLCSKQVTLAGRQVTVSGMAKGAGMIKPNMATMLAFVATDAEIDQPDLEQLLARAVGRSFNRLTVDGDTSTNDACMLIATGRSGVRIDPGSVESEVFIETLFAVFHELATGLIRDAEGASKFVSIIVQGGADAQECLAVAYCVAESPLVKTAFFASDPNWGRILAAVGRAGVENLDVASVSISLGQTTIVSRGEPDPAYREELGQAEMDRPDIVVTIDLGRGDSSQTVWTSDLSHDYVRINADYRT